MSNNLPVEKKLAVLGALVEGCSIRSTERLTNTHRDTITRLLVRVGEGCASILDEKMRNLGCERLELDELWSFVGKKQRHVKASDDASRVVDQWPALAVRFVPAPDPLSLEDGHADQHGTSEGDRSSESSN